MAMVHLTIDGVPVSVEEGTTVLKAAHAAGIKIPTLCWLKDINEIGACRMCVVDVGARSLAAACVMPVSEGMVVKTNTPQVRKARKAVLELILSNHERKCLSCVRSQNCELQDLAKELGVEENRFEGENIHYPLDNFSPSIVRDPNKCILCRRCVAVCRNVQKIGAIGAVNRGFKTVIAPAFGKTMLETDCIFCGRRTARARRYGQGLGRARRSDEVRRRAAGARCPRGSGRGIRSAHRHPRYRQDDAGSAPSGL